VVAAIYTPDRWGRTWWHSWGFRTATELWQNRAGLGKVRRSGDGFFSMAAPLSILLRP